MCYSRDFLEFSPAKSYLLGMPIRDGVEMSDRAAANVDAYCIDVAWDLHELNAANCT